MEHADPLGVKYNACPQCQTAKSKQGLLIHPPGLTPDRCRPAVILQTYREYHNAITASNHQAIMITEDWFHSVSARPVTCICRDLLHVEAYDVHWLDTLHTPYIEMFLHLMAWIKGFLQCHRTATVMEWHLGWHPSITRWVSLWQSLPTKSALEW